MSNFELDEVNCPSKLMYCTDIHVRCTPLKIAKSPQILQSIYKFDI